MIIVMASAVDPHAAALLPHFRKLEARLLTPADLSHRGWVVRTDRPLGGCLVAGGERIALDHVQGVVSLLPAVFPQELVAIEEPARAYAAQEMTAFLRYVLTSLPCPVLNQATAGSLCGPLWRPERWLQVAASCGIATDVWHRRSGDALEAQTDEGLVTMTLIGNEMVDRSFNHFRVIMRTLARAASVGMLSARFRLSDRGPLFCGADVCPQLSGPRAAALIEKYFVRLKRNEGVKLSEANKVN